MNRVKVLNILSFLIVATMALFAVTGCGPTREEIMAMEQARIAAEAERARAAEEARKQAEAKRKAEEERLARIRATEIAADEAARIGQFEKALEQYQGVLSNVARYSDQDQRVRQAIIKTVRAMSVPPAIPESVMRSMVRAETKLKMGGTGSYEAAAKEMEQAVLEAPWVADAYFNLGIVQEKAGKFNEAIQNLRLYLFAEPRSPNAAAIQAKTYELEVMKEEQDKIQALQGTWYTEGSHFTWVLQVESKKIFLQSGDNITSIQVEREGRSLNGFIQFGSYTPSYQSPPIGISKKVETWYRCTRQAETEAVSGTISEDGRSMVFNCQKQIYEEKLKKVTAQVNYDPNRCEGIALVGKEEYTLKLVRKQ